MTFEDRIRTSLGTMMWQILQLQQQVEQLQLQLEDDDGDEGTEEPTPDTD